MKHEKLSDALNEISDRHLTETLQKKRRPYWLGGLAAALALAILALSLSRPMTVHADAISLAAEPRVSSTRPSLDDFETLEEYRQASQLWDAQREARTVNTKKALASLSSFFLQGDAEFLTGSQSNTLWSPANASIGLAMLTELTAGSTQSQLLEALGAEDTAALRSSISALWESVYYQRDKEQSLLANSLWLEEGLNYEKAATDALSYDYYASIYRGDLGSEKINKAIGTWLNNNTGGLLKKSADSIQLPESAVLALYSTLYIQSKWQDQFKASNNTQSAFHAPSGDKTVTFMNKKLHWTNYYWGDTFGAVCLGLKNGCEMWFILPDEGLTPQDVILDGEYMELLLGDTTEVGGAWKQSKFMKVNLSVPKFDVTQTQNLKDGLQRMGITDLFSPENSDFTAITSDVPVYITGANQAVRVQIDEEGVKAAAYIELIGATSPLPPEEIIDFVLNRPFLFAITQNNVPMITGVINEP